MQYYECEQVVSVTEPEFFKVLRTPGIDSTESIPYNLSPLSVLEFITINGGYEPSRNRVVVPVRQAIWAGGIDSLESIPRLLIVLKYRLCSHGARNTPAVSSKCHLYPSPSRELLNGCG
jgi:hypothetical protein